MPDDLHRSIARALTPSVPGLLARHLGETPGAVRLGLDAAISASLRAAVLKSASAAGAEEVLDVLRASRPVGAGLLQGNPPGFERRLRAAAPDDPLATSTAAADRLFSGRAPGLIDHISSFARLQRSSSAALIRLGAALVLAALEDAGAGKETPVGLRRMLKAKAGDLARVTPRGFDPDLGGGPVRGGSGAVGWAPWLLVAVLLALLALLGLRSLQDDAPGAVIETAPPPPGLDMSAGR